jgi:CheY-like chemotaxis protein
MTGCRKLPAIALTAYARKQDAEAALAPATTVIFPSPSRPPI